MVTCPNCGRRNNTDNAYCANCGFRLPTAAARGTGVAYRRAEQAEPHGGGGQGLLAFGAVLLAGLLFAVGAVALVMSPSADASRTPITGAAVDPTSSLPIFTQEAPSTAPLPSFTPLPSYALFTPTPAISIVPPSFATVPPFTVPPPATPTATPVAPPRTPRPTPTATPVATPVNCSSANGSEMRTEVIGYGNEQSFGPIPRALCVHEVVIRPYVDFPFTPGEDDTSSIGKPGVTRLLENGQRLFGDGCSATECNDKSKNYSPPHLAPAGTTFAYDFQCDDNPATLENECDLPGGATVEIRYEILRGT